MFLAQSFSDDDVFLLAVVMYRASVNTFGYIAKAIGPQDVLHTLLNNLKVKIIRAQESTDDIT